MKSCPVLIVSILLSASLEGRSAGNDAPLGVRSERMILEEKHFIECLAYVYSPSLWISYRDSLYFTPKDEATARVVEALKTARSRYVALTNRETRHEIAASIIATSGIDKKWQQKLLLPYSETQQNLTPTLNRPFLVVNSYKIVQSLGEGDVLIQDEQGTYLVMDFERAVAKGASTNLYLIKEGERAFATKAGDYQKVQAFSNLGLSTEETRILNRVVAACQNKAAALAQELAGFKAQQEFADLKARATDNNPYLEYLLARCYLDGRGIQKDERLGLEWMQKADRNGSGDAKTYLQNRRENHN
jgi:Sel1 repeat-containing protein